MISAFLIQQERRRGRRVLRQRDGAPEVGDDLVSAGLRPSSAETRSRGKTVEICGRAAVAKLCQISPKTPLYIGGGGGRPALGSKDSQGGRPSQGGGSPPPKPKSTWFGRWSPSSLSHLLFFLFLFDFLPNAHRPLLGCATRPLRAGVTPQMPMGFPGVGCPPPVNSRNPFVIPGTFPVTPKTFR